MGYYKHGQVELGDDIGHSEGFAAAGNAHQGLELFARVQILRQPLNGFRLVARRLKLVVQFEYAHRLYILTVSNRGDKCRAVPPPKTLLVELIGFGGKLQGYDGYAKGKAGVGTK